MKIVVKISIIVGLTAILAGCASEESKIKSSLKTSISSDKLKDYDYISHQITETILENNIQDSIGYCESKKLFREGNLNEKDKRKNSYISNMNELRYQKQHTLPWFRSDYTSMIRDWQRMLDNLNKEMKKDSLFIDSLGKRIDYFNSILEKAESPIIFYKVKHEYKLYGAYHCDIVLLDSNYKIVEQ